MRMNVHLGTQLCTGDTAALTHIHLFWWVSYKERSLPQGWKKGDSSKTQVHSRYSIQTLMSHMHFLYLLPSFRTAAHHIRKSRCRTLHLQIHSQDTRRYREGMILFNMLRGEASWSFHGLERSVVTDLILVNIFLVAQLVNTELEK